MCLSLWGKFSKKKGSSTGEKGLPYFTAVTSHLAGQDPQPIIMPRGGGSQRWDNTSAYILGVQNVLLALEGRALPASCSSTNWLFLPAFWDPASEARLKFVKGQQHLSSCLSVTVE
ncbi:unnamed protein product [Caretta caretta]